MRVSVHYKPQSTARHMQTAMYTQLYSLCFVWCIYLPSHITCDIRNLYLYLYFQGTHFSHIISHIWVLQANSENTDCEKLKTIYTEYALGYTFSHNSPCMQVQRVHCAMLQLVPAQSLQCEMSLTEFNKYQHYVFISSPSLHLPSKVIFNTCPLESSHNNCQFSLHPWVAKEDCYAKFTPKSPHKTFSAGHFYFFMLENEN